MSCQYQSLEIYVYLFHDKLVNSANDNKKVDNKFYFYFSEALNYKHYQAFFVFFCLFYIMRVLILYAKNHNLNNHNWSCGVTLLKI